MSEEWKADVRAMLLNQGDAPEGERLLAEFAIGDRLVTIRDSLIESSEELDQIEEPDAGRFSEDELTILVMLRNSLDSFLSQAGLSTAAMEREKTIPDVIGRLSPDDLQLLFEDYALNRLPGTVDGVEEHLARSLIDEVRARKDHERAMEMERLKAKLEAEGVSLSEQAQLVAGRFSEWAGAGAKIQYFANRSN